MSSTFTLTTTLYTAPQSTTHGHSSSRASSSSRSEGEGEDESEDEVAAQSHLTLSAQQGAIRLDPPPRPLSQQTVLNVVSDLFSRIQVTQPGLTGTQQPLFLDSDSELSGVPSSSDEFEEPDSSPPPPPPCRSQRRNFTTTQPLPGQTDNSQQLPTIRRRDGGTQQQPTPPLPINHNRRRSSRLAPNRPQQLQEQPVDPAENQAVTEQAIAQEPPPPAEEKDNKQPQAAADDHNLDNRNHDEPQPEDQDPVIEALDPLRTPPHQPEEPVHSSPASSVTNVDPITHSPRFQTRPLSPVPEEDLEEARIHKILGKQFTHTPDATTSRENKHSRSETESPDCGRSVIPAPESKSFSHFPSHLKSLKRCPHFFLFVLPSFIQTRWNQLAESS